MSMGAPGIDKVILSLGVGGECGLELTTGSDDGRALAVTAEL